MIDLQTSFTLSKAIFAYKAIVRWFGTSKCGRYLGTIGLTVDSNNPNKFVDTLKIWDLKDMSLDLLFERTFDQEVYCL